MASSDIQAHLFIDRGDVVSVVHTNDSEDCKLKYPNDEVGQKINCGEIGIPNNHENQ